RTGADGGGVPLGAIRLLGLAAGSQGSLTGLAHKPGSQGGGGSSAKRRRGGARLKRIRRKLVGVARAAPVLRGGPHVALSGAVLSDDAEHTLLALDAVPMPRPYLTTLLADVHA